MGRGIGSNRFMRFFRVPFLICLLLVLLPFTAAAQRPSQQASRPAAAEELFALANQSRSQAGAGPLRWDAALAQAAMHHCEWMVREGQLSHRYGGEPDLTQRASAAGAHFSLIEENIAVGSYAAQIHDGWMHSPGHRTNLLNPQVDRVGIAVIEAHGGMYAVADYSRGVSVLSAEQVESRVGELLRMSGITMRRDDHDARLACRVDHGFPADMTDGQAKFVMRWQGADLDHLPQDLVDRLGSGRYRSAEVGACQPRNAQEGFTVYRLAVLLY
jgi:hypothetical protein